MTQRSVSVKVDADISSFNRAMLAGSASAKTFANELDSSTDRATNLTQSVLAFGPALVPLGAAGVPAVAGLANQLGLAATAAGVATLALSGVGDALKAVNEYQLDPTAANFAKMSETMGKLGPAGQEFVRFLQELRPELQGLQDAAQAGLLPGAEDGIRSLMELMPQAESTVSIVSKTLGDLIAEAGDNLNDPRWREFFDFLERDARPTLLDMGRTLGNVAEGFANLWMAFSPLSAQFSTSFLSLSRDFAQWTDGLDQTQGFQEFLDYVSRVGPEVWDTLGAVANALVQIVEAAAPVGEATLPVITALADALAVVADSDFGPVIIGVVSLTSALSRLKALGTLANTSAMANLLSGSAYAGAGKGLRDLPTAILQYDGAAARAQASVGQLASTTGRLGTALKGTAKAAGGAAGLAFVMSDLDDKMGLSKTAMLGLAGSMIGPWGAALGAGAGLALDFAAANDSVWDSLKRVDQALAQGPTGLAQQQAALSEAKKNLEDLKRDSDKTYLGGLVGSREKYKNAYEGFFGRSDVEEAQEAVDEANKKVAESGRQAARAAQDQQFAEAGLASSMADVSDEARKQMSDMLANIAVKNRAADAAENAFSAETNYRRALKEARAQAKTNNAGIDGSSEAALRNRESLDQLAGAWNRVADSGQGTRAQMRAARKNFIEVAQSMGVSRSEARALADELFHIPSPKPKVTVQSSGALQNINEVLDYLARIRDKNVTITTTRQDRGSDAGKAARAPSAFGNIFAAYAGGGVEQHIPQIGNGAFTRVWNEPETKGEAYIPLANDWRRPRAEAIWEETGRLLGMQHFANGGLEGAARLPSRPATQPMAARLADNTVRVEKDGLVRLVDDRVLLSSAAHDNYAAAGRRAGR